MKEELSSPPCIIDTASVPTASVADATATPTQATSTPAARRSAATRVRAPKQVVDRAAYLVLVRGCSTKSVAAAFGLNTSMLSKHIQRLRMKRKSAGSAAGAIPGATAVDAAHTDEQIRAFVDEIAKKLQPSQ